MTRLGVTRRRLLGGAAAGALLFAAVGRSTLQAANRVPAAAGGRDSRITRGTFLVHADLHNHTLFSDGVGDPAAAFPSMRAAGLDVAALTDHAVLGAALPVNADVEAAGGHRTVGLDPVAWRRTGELAAAHDRPGEFTAIRGFEWSHPRLGHVNAWFSDSFTDVGLSGTMGSLYEWLSGAGTSTAGIGGGPVLAGFNHPGREPCRFADFKLEPAVRDQVVSLEVFNRTDDFLFEGVAAGRSSPLMACLDAGWRTGLLGVTDEHGDVWGFPEGKGRAGLWVTEHTRRGVAEALLARRFFATRVSGLRVDATANGTRMGATLRHRSGPVAFALDLDRGPAWAGLPLQVQVLRSGAEVPEVAELVDVRCGELVRFTVPLDIADGGWVLLRVADPTEPNDTPGPPGHPANNAAVAYTSPWFLEP